MGTSTSKKLYKINENKLDPIPNKNNRTKARIVNVHDGDTFTCVFLYNKTEPMKINIRLNHVDAPELKSKNELERKAAFICTKFVKDIILDEIVDVYFLKWDKYGGRIIADVEYKNRSGKMISLSDIMVGSGIARLYNGEKKKPWSKSELEAIYNIYEKN